MRGTIVFVALTVASAVAFHADLDACGDKSLSAGGIRMQRALATRYPASILIYVQPNSRLVAAARELKLQESLRQVGHTYREVTSASELDAAIGSGRFNIVMADFADLTEVERSIEGSTARPATIGVAYKLTKAEAKVVAGQHRFLVNAPSRAAQYLSTIADAVRSTSSSSSKG
jgi:hypothetical protein